MKKTLILLVILLLSNCKEKEQIQNDEKEPDVMVEPVNNTMPIFYGLSPKMSSIKFLVKLKRDPFENGNFAIQINEEKLTFKVKQENNHIALVFREVENYSINGYDYKTVNELINVYLKKYPTEITNLPFRKEFREKEYMNVIGSSRFINGINEKQLKDYGFYREYYRVFQDSIRTVFIGYSVYGKSKVNIEKSSSTNNKNTKKDNNGESLKSILIEVEREMALNESTNINLDTPTKYYGLEIDISYFHNDDFKILLNGMLQDKKEFDNAIMKNDSNSKAIVEKNKKNLESM